MWAFTRALGPSSFPSNPGLFWSGHQRLFAEGPGKAPPAFNTSPGTGKGAALSLAVAGRISHRQRRKEPFASCNKGLLGALCLLGAAGPQGILWFLIHHLLCRGTVYMVSLGSGISLQSQNGGVSLHGTPKTKPMWQIEGMEGI